MRDPDALISTAALEARLGRGDLRCYDCTTYLEPAEVGAGVPFRVVSGRETFLAGHVPGADFLELQDELSAAATPVLFMMPPIEQLARAFGRHGLGDGSRVVLYSAGSMMWATRVWWMLRSVGFDRAAVLDGGFDAWQGEGRARGVSAGHLHAPAAARPLRRQDDGPGLDR
jgi:thiosulfate/3-mercaptopyruvate sulfurtransferase